MSSYGKDETNILKKNLKDQLERLVQQLEDLDECKDELDSSEYEETKRDTMDQMKELNESLQKMLSGDMTLVDDLGAMQLAIQAAICKSFTTPAVIRMFSKREPKLLRERFESIQRDTKLGKITKESSERQLHEILNALKQLGENLSSQEVEFLNTMSYNTVDAGNFLQISDYSVNGHEALAIASQQVRDNRSS
ncbi:hypothetical protein PV328_000169 [Microctonus aethiopoides]|uniref:Beta-catenin-interacting ICAT domain-containing protein n=1 Tax=Microctonus aethiopoides TaxID=144406 RepID=A0AA39FUC1_9HYME|nr:hypothetical protein PV328_000169 [Microctonus aethiopoides]